MTVYSRPDGVLLREVDGELLLLNSESGLYFGLNPTGAAMYQSLCAGESPDDAVAKVSEEFSAEREVVAADCRVLVEQLVAKGLLGADG